MQSWVAMERGDWGTAVRLIEEMRAGRAEHQRKLDEKGIVQRRVRIVTRPLTPYLQWELTALRVYAELGEEIRVLSTTAVRDLESVRKLPEVLVFALIVIVVGLVALSPFALDAFGNGPEWSQRSEIGQTYGAAAALLSVLALEAHRRLYRTLPRTGPRRTPGTRGVAGAASRARRTLRGRWGVPDARRPGRGRRRPAH